MEDARVYPAHRDWFYSCSHKGNAQKIEERASLMLEKKQHEPAELLKQLTQLEDLPAKKKRHQLLANPVSFKVGQKMRFKIHLKSDTQKKAAPIILDLPLPESAPKEINGAAASVLRRICEHIMQNPEDTDSNDAVLGGGRLGKEAVVNATVRSVCRSHGLPNPPLRLIAPTFSKQRRRFVVMVRRIDPDILHHDSITKIYVIAKNMREDLQVPEIPENGITWVLGTSPDAGEVHNIDDRLPGSTDEVDDREQLEMAFKVAKYVTFVFEASAGSHSDLRAAMNALVSGYSRNKPRQERVGMKLQGSRRLEILVSPRFSTLCVSAASSGWKNVLPRLNIQSSRPIRQFRAAEMIMRPPEPGVHLVDAWKQAALEADAENDRIDRGIDPPELYPVGALKPMDMCLCRGCGRQIPFVESKKHTECGWLVCLQCSLLSVDEMDHAHADQLPLSLHGRMSALIRTQDYGSRGLSSSDTRQEREFVVTQHKKMLAPAKMITSGSHSAVSWRDAYSDMFPKGLYDSDKRFWTSGLVPRRVSPFVATVDAVYRVADDMSITDSAIPPRDPLSWHHALGNVVITSASLNFLKAHSPPVILKIFRQYRQGQSVGELKHAFQGLLNLYLIDAATCIGRSQDWPTGLEKNRLKRSWYGARFTRLPTVAEIKSTIRWLLPQGRWNEHDASWRPPKELQNRFSEIPASWGFKVARSDFQGEDSMHDYRLWCTQDVDGNWVPYPFEPLSKPYVDWTWWRLHVWMESRFSRTVQTCNASWPTDTSLDTYQLSLMQSHFSHLSRDLDSLRQARRVVASIPDRDPVPRDDFGLCAWPWDGGRVSASVAHRRDHKLAMDGGYAGNQNIGSVDFVYDDNKRNISLDTRATNFSVYDFAVETWQDIGKQLDHLVDHGLYWEPGVSQWANEDWVDGNALDPADCIKLSAKNREALEENDRFEGEQGDREMSMLGAGLGTVTMEGLESGAESSVDDGDLSDESQSSEDDL